MIKNVYISLLHRMFQCEYDIYEKSDTLDILLYNSKGLLVLKFYGVIRAVRMAHSQKYLKIDKS